MEDKDLVELVRAKIILEALGGEDIINFNPYYKECLVYYLNTNYELDNELNIEAKLIKAVKKEIKDYE